MARVPQREIPQEEQAVGKAYDLQILRRLWTYISPHRRLVWMSLVLVPVIAGVEILQPLIVKYGIDHNLSKKSIDGLGWVALAFAFSLIVHGLFQYVYLYILNITGQRAMRDLRRGMFRHLQRLPNSFFDKSPLGRIMTRLTNDVESLNEMFASGLVSLVGDFVKMVGIVVIMLTVNFRLALVTFSIVPVLVFLTWIFRMRMRDAYRAIRVKIALINAYLQESLSGMQIVQLYVREGHNLDEFSQVNAEHREANYLSIKYDALLFAIVEAAGRLTIALVIWYGAGLVYTHLLGQQMPGLVETGITIGTLYAFIDWIGKFFEPIRDLSAKYAVMQAAMASSERIFELLDTPVESEEPEEPVDLEHVRGEIEFRNVSFAYNPGDEVLRDLSFTVKAGEKIAVVGHTGAGKTTIIRLLSRFYEPQSGEILLDGVNIRNLRMRDLRRRLGIVLQDVFIFSGDIDYNIRLGNPEITQQQVRDAARNVNADRFIQRLPRGYHEELRERGGNLSVGQRQLLSFARALAYDPAILILDEATSSVDTETELLIQDAVRALMRDRTSIVIAHRLSTIRDVDRILVLHKGQLREAGTHVDLLAQRGIYYKLYELQYRDQGNMALAGSPSMSGTGEGS